jgi:mxaA protein
MKNLIIKWIALVSLFGSLAIGMPSAMAQEPDAKILSISNPSLSNGIQVGDVLNRTIVIEVNTPYQISKIALPMKGEVRNGIELADITVTSSEKAKKNIVSIALRYQVLISAAKPVVMQLPKEEFTLTGGDKALSIKVPAWNFWFSPLVAEGIPNAKENLQPQYKPTLIDVSAHHARFLVSLALLITGLLGLVYINADKRWLPFMNGAFAQAHRSLKKLPSNQASEEKALIYMHQAFNTIHGENLFANNVEQFLATHPAFTQLKTDIAHFFEQSSASLFGSQQQNSEQFINKLIVLSKRLRDCERGV